MELTINGLIGRRLDAIDGKTGKVNALYFDDRSWKIRYMVVKTGNWLSGDKVLIFPHALVKEFRSSGVFAVRLTREQVRNGPKIDTYTDAGKRDAENPHLRSTSVVTGYRMHAHDGDMGYINDFVLDDRTLQITYLVIDTHGWLGGKRVLVDVRHITEIQWENSKVLANITFNTIKNSQGVCRRIESVRGRVNLLYLLSENYITN